MAARASDEKFGVAFSLCILFASFSWAGTPATLEDAEGNTVQPPPAEAYVYSDRSGSGGCFKSGHHPA